MKIVLLLYAWWRNVHACILLDTRTSWFVSLLVLVTLLVYGLAD